MIDSKMQDSGCKIQDTKCSVTPFTHASLSEACIGDLEEGTNNFCTVNFC